LLGVNADKKYTNHVSKNQILIHEGVSINLLVELRDKVCN